MLFLRNPFRPIVNMNYDFTDGTRKALTAARAEAARLQHDYVGPEHILLGLLAKREGVAAAVLESRPFDPDRIRERVERVVSRGRAAVTGNLPYTSRAKKTLEFAMAEARQLQHSYVGQEHLLLGLLREEKGIAADVLVTQFGVTLNWARMAVLHQVETGGEIPVPPRGGAPSPFAVEIDDASPLSIYEQIVAQVKEAIATQRVRPGDRLPTVRQLADQLDIAPGTVARAYAELERLGVVVTEGARGTRVAERRREIAGSERPETLTGLLRPVAVAAFHLGASAPELRAALEEAMRGIFADGPPAGAS